MSLVRTSSLAAALLLRASVAPLAQTSPAALPLKLAPRPTSAAITPADLMTRLYVFADDSMMGRQVGTEYNLKGTAYIEREVRRLGLVPAGDDGTYFQNLPITRRTLAAGQSLTVDGTAFTPWTDFLPRDDGPGARSLDGAPAVFGGVFGDTAAMLRPEASAGKVVVLVVAPGPDGAPRWQANRAALVQYYADAAAVVVASLDAIPAEIRALLAEPMALMEPADEPADTLPAFLYASAAMTRALLGGDPGAMTRGQPGATVHGAMRFESAPAPGRNVVALLRGSDPVLRNQYVAIGAHNDHVGYDHSPVDHDSLRAYNAVVRPQGADSPDRQPTDAELARVQVILDSLRRQHAPRLDSIYNGADDDGSGTVSVLEIAEAFAHAPRKPKRSILFVWHAGEEAGLWGSEWFTDHPTVPRDSIVAQLNMDMVGRGRADDTPGGGAGYVQLIGSRRLSTELGDLVEAVARAEPTSFHFDYQYDANGHPEQYYCRSDHYEYARYGIPITFFSTGGHRDYHQVTDEPQYIDYAQLARVTTLVHDVAQRVADLDHRVVIDHPKPDPHGECVQ